MKILIDECLPKKLKTALPDYASNTVQEMGWAGKKNGELLKLMVGQFDVFITIDKNMQYQHMLDQLPIAFIVLDAENNKFETLHPLMEQVLDSLSMIEEGQIIKITKKDPNGS